MLAGHPPEANTDAEFDALISKRAVRPVFQPIVSLHDGQTVGYEALARGPAGTVFHAPQALFRHAARVGRLAELDWICRAAACRDALAAVLPWRIPLFINAEPATLRAPPPRDLVEIIRTASKRLQMVIEMTERSVNSDPAALLAAVVLLRRWGMRIALDDVGADPASLTVMPLISPDVIKRPHRRPSPRRPADVACRARGAGPGATHRRGCYRRGRRNATPSHNSQGHGRRPRPGLAVRAPLAPAQPVHLGWHRASPDHRQTRIQDRRHGTPTVTG